MNPTTRTHHFTLIRQDIQLLFGVSLALASTAALILTLQDLVTGFYAKAVAFIAGVALQGCLYLFANDKNHRVKGFSLFLLALSVCMTTWFMERTWQTQQVKIHRLSQQQADTSWEAEQYRQQVKELNRRINSLITSTDRDVNGRYRGRGLETDTKVDELTKQRDSLLNDLDQLTDSVVEINQPSVIEQNNYIRLSLFFSLSIIIDISAIIALSGLQNREIWLPLKKEKKSTKANEPGLTTNEEPQVQPMDTIMTKIRAGDYGDFVPVKQIIQEEQVRHHELKQGLLQLLAEGILEKEGGRYRMARGY